MTANRRDFLKSVIGASSLVSLSTAAPSFLLRACMAAESGDRAHANALVVVQLSGGNDGLNTIVPYEDDAYGRGRQTLRLAGKDVHKIDEQLGFHPAMSKAFGLFREGQLGVVQGVGYPNSDRDHDNAMRDWHTAHPGMEFCQTGWLGRAVDELCQSDPLLAPGMCVAPIGKPLLMNAEKSVVPCVTSAGQCVLRDSISPPPAKSDTDNPLADLARQAAVASFASSRKVREILDRGDSKVEYPHFALAQQLKTVVEIVRADVGVRFFFTELGGGGIGGFDNHANQRDNHAAVLRELSESLAAFADDLRQHKLLDRVLLMTFSEFGRTLRENGRRGTDHGAAAPVLLVGGQLKGGLTGEHPSLTDLDGDSPRHHTDFRRLYATALDKWLQIPSHAVLGQRFEPLDILRS